MSEWISVKDKLPNVGVLVKVLLTNGIEAIDYVNKPIDKDVPFQHYLVLKWKTATKEELTQYNMENFNLYTDEKVNKLQEYIENHFSLDETSKHLVRNILIYTSAQSEDAEETLDMLEVLLDGVGITREEMANAVV